MRSSCHRAAKVIRAASIPAIAFEIGVLNLIVLAWLFGAHPEHYWLAYVVEFPVILALVVHEWSKAGRCLYLCEFCWVINFFGWLYLLLEALPFYTAFESLLSPAARLGLARSFFSTANGPLALSVRHLCHAPLSHASSTLTHAECYPECTAVLLSHFPSPLLSRLSSLYCLVFRRLPLIFLS